MTPESRTEYEEGGDERERGRPASLIKRELRLMNLAIDYFAPPEVRKKFADPASRGKWMPPFDPNKGNKVVRLRGQRRRVIRRIPPFASLTESWFKPTAAARRVLYKYNPFCASPMGTAQLVLAHYGQSSLKAHMERMLGSYGQDLVNTLRKEAAEMYERAGVDAIDREGVFYDRWDDEEFESYGGDQYPLKDARYERPHDGDWYTRFVIRNRATGEEIPWFFPESVYGYDRTDTLIPWVAKLVNAWLKQAPSYYPLSVQDDVVEDEVIDRIDAVITRLEQDEAYRTRILAAYNQTLKAYEPLQLLSRRIAILNDWVRETRPDLMSLRLTQALYRSRIWHRQFMLRQERELRKEDAERLRVLSAEVAKQPPAVAFVAGHYTVYTLDTKAQLEEEGLCQNHCVGGYWKDVRDGRTTIYSLRDKTLRYATIEVEQGGVRQVYGPGNKIVRDKTLRKVIAEFLVYIGAVSDEYRKEMEAVRAEKKPPETLSGLLGTNSTFSGFFAGF